MSSKVAICVVTYRRPDQLGKLLTALQVQAFGNTTKPTLDLIVVDNDSQSSGFPAFEATDMSCFSRNSYLVEPRKGLSTARNRAVQSCDDGTEFIAMIDDDELPIESWLEELLICQHRYDADAVFGPVIPKYVDHAKEWIVRGGFHTRPRLKSGSIVQTGGTGNVLVRHSLLESVPGPFDSRFDAIGGEDSHLFLSLQRSGGHFRWCDEAVVYEEVPPSRCTIRYLLGRSFRIGASDSVSLRLLSDWTNPSLEVLYRSSRAIAREGLLLLLSVPKGRVAGMAALFRLVRSIGRLAGFFGVSYRQYA